MKTMRNYRLSYKEFLKDSFDQSNEIQRCLKLPNIIHALVNTNSKDLQFYNELLKNRYRQAKK